MSNSDTKSTSTVVRLGRSSSQKHFKKATTENNKYGIFDSAMPPACDIQKLVGQKELKNQLERSRANR